MPDESPVAILHNPPPTVEQSSAEFLAPPATVELLPVAILHKPPPTVD